VHETTTLLLVTLPNIHRFKKITSHTQQQPHHTLNGQWCIAKNGGGYTQTGVAKGLKIPCLFMIAQVSIRCQKNPEVGIRRIPAYTPNTPLHVATLYLVIYRQWLVLLTIMFHEVV